MSTGKINELQNKIIQIKTELSEINKDETPLPEFIDTTNMLRSNEYLKKSNEEKSKLLIAYEEYTDELENLVTSISKIKANITNLKSRIKSRKKPKKKVKKKRILKRKSRKRKTKAKPRRSKSRKSRR
jgi:predicted  nucleic acid-binding Zn-ribbon protein